MDSTLPECGGEGEDVVSGDGAWGCGDTYCRPATGEDIFTCPSDCNDNYVIGCGDGELNGESSFSGREQCDDNNTISGDGCSSTCQIETVTGYCGDGNIDSNEACDDDNTLNGDGCSALCQIEVSPTVAVCDAVWRKIPGSQQTISGPAGVYIGYPKNTQFVDSVALVMRGSDSRVYEQACKFNLTNTCNWASGWVPDMEFPNNISNFQSAVAPYASVGDGWDVYARNAFNHMYHNYNLLDGWHNWQDQGVNDSAAWGTPFRFTDKLNRRWQIRRNQDGSVSYNCGAPGGGPVCVDMVFNPNSSTVTPTTVNQNDTVDITCDFGARMDAIDVSFAGASNCTGQGWTGTGYKYRCQATQVGTNIPVYCSTRTGTSDNICAQTGQKQVGVINTTANVAVTSFTANPSTIPYNTASTLAWSYSNATSCTITSPGTISGYPAGSGSVSTGNLTASRTYTLTCDPGAVTKNAVVTVQGATQDVTLTVIKAGQGSVTSAPAGINCGSDCAEGYTSSNNTSVVLTAAPATRRIFTGWTVTGGGTCAGRGTCTVIMNASKTVTANFAIDPNYQEF